MTRGFAAEEFGERAARAQSRLEEAGLGALLLTTEPDVREITGLPKMWAV